MPKPDYDDPAVDELWCSERRKTVAGYLGSQKIKHGRVGERPAWYVAPYASIWAIESVARPEWIGWWVISGVLPTDYISSSEVNPPQHPRKAMRVFAQKWLEVVKTWNDGREIENTQIGDPSSHMELGPLLEARGKLLMEWADDDSPWEDV
jgi:hypothetical protein